MATGRVLIAGASGTIGSELVPYLLSHGYNVDVLQRKDPDAPFYWNPTKGQLSTAITNYDAVINLSGVNVTEGLWTEKRKQKILDSRVVSTKLLVDAMKEHPPKVFISASAVGYYGNTHDEEVDEAHSSGTGFLADVCRKWEHEALQANTRVVILRMGVVLTKKGGALKKMLTPFKLGLGAVLGTGNQWMSWIGMPDLLEIFHAHRLCRHAC